MKKILTAVALAGALSLPMAAPAQAAKDGETGYAIGCMILWHVFDMWTACQEIQTSNAMK